jgi:hypothetical protein
MLYGGEVVVCSEIKKIINTVWADLQKVFSNKIKRVQACIDACEHHFQHVVQVHSDFPNARHNSYMLNRLVHVTSRL